MYLRRIFLGCSLVASLTSSAFADYQTLDRSDESDRLESLSRTLSQGSYSHPDDLDLPASARMSVTLREKSVELNNQSIERKYGASSTQRSTQFSSNTGSNSSWFVKHPLPGMTRISSEYGMRTLMGTTRGHSGIDFAAPSGTPIYTTGSGIVTKAGWGTGYGQYVEVNHGNGYLTRYAHASRILVRAGDRVKAGEHIADVGCTGRCTGPHLHFEVVRDGARKNPSSYLALLP